MQKSKIELHIQPGAAVLKLGLLEKISKVSEASEAYSVESEKTIVKIEGKHKFI